MVEIKRFELVPDADIYTLLRLREGGSWIHPDSMYFVSKAYADKNSEISISIAFPENLSDWNDFDYVSVLDEDFGQPYTPFYQRWNGESVDFPFLDKIVTEYNRFMCSIPILKEILK